LHGIFSFDGYDEEESGEGGKMTQLEKRLTMSKNSERSKSNDKAMIKKRRTRNNVKNHFMTVDGDDI